MEGRPAVLREPLYDTAAPGLLAWLALTIVHGEIMLEISKRSVSLPVVAQR
jgi:hypothetical protein